MTGAPRLHCSQRRIQLSSLQRKTTPFITSFLLSSSVSLCLGSCAALFCFSLCPSEGFWSPSKSSGCRGQTELPPLRLLNSKVHIRSRSEQNNSQGCNLSRLVTFFFWLGIIFTSISSHSGPTHPLQLGDREQDRLSHGAINIYSAHSSSSYCSAPVWRGGIVMSHPVTDTCTAAPWRSTPRRIFYISCCLSWFYSPNSHRTEACCVSKSCPGNQGSV